MFIMKKNITHNIDKPVSNIKQNMDKPVSNIKQNTDKPVSNVSLILMKFQAVLISTFKAEIG